MISNCPLIYFFGLQPWTLFLILPPSLCSPEFRNITELSLNKLVKVLVEEIDMQLKGSSSSSRAIPLVTLLPRVTQLAPQLLEEPSSNKFIQIIQSLPEVELFYTLLYSNMPPIY